MGKFSALFSLDETLLALGCSALAIGRLPQYVFESGVRKKNRELGKKRSGDRCYILGLGPSLRDVDLHKLEGDIFATNGYVLCDEKDRVRPDFYCLVDGAFYEGGNGILKAARAAYPDATFLLNGKFRNAVEKSADAPINKYFFYMWAGPFSARRELDCSKLTPLAGNVVCFAIMAALYMGYREIVLLGCDFNSFARRKSEHCYIESDDSRRIGMDYELFCYSFVARTHIELAKYAQNHGVKIVNATAGSLIDAYEYDEAMSRSFLKDRV